MYINADDYADSGSQEGSSLSSIVDSITKLGTVALLSYAPQNAAAGVNPYGEASRYPATVKPADSGVTTLLILGVAILGGIYAFKKL
jgi:hypothetical protein